MQLWLAVGRGCQHLACVHVTVVGLFSRLGRGLFLRRECSWQMGTCIISI